MKTFLINVSSLVIYIFFMCPRVENRNATVQTLAYLTTLACFDARKIPSQILSQGMDHRMPCDSRGKKINIE